jgi:hypothetical protein
MMVMIEYDAGGDDHDGYFTDFRPDEQCRVAGHGHSQTLKSLKGTVGLWSQHV